MGFFDNKTVTLFNRSFDPVTEKEKYYPTFLENVDLVETKGANVSKSGMDSADAATLYVDFQVIDKMEKQYIEPKEWESLSDDEKKAYITFVSGEDFFVKGDHMDVVLPENGAYEWMHNHYDGVYRVSNVDKYEDVLPHFEVGGV